MGIQKDLTICSLQKTHFRYKATDKLKVKGEKMIIQREQMLLRQNILQVKNCYEAKKVFK